MKPRLTKERVLMTPWLLKLWFFFVVVIIALTVFGCVVGGLSFLPSILVILTGVVASPFLSFGVLKLLW